MSDLFYFFTAFSHAFTSFNDTTTITVTTLSDSLVLAFRNQFIKLHKDRLYTA